MEISSPPISRGCQLLALMTIAAATESAHADWTLETTTHPTQSTQVLNIHEEATLVAQFVFGGASPAKPYLNLFGTDGEILTQGEPNAQFPHHRGFFLGWDEVDSALGSHDLWHMDTGTMTIAAVERIASDSDGATFRVRTEWRADPTGSGNLLLTEWRTIRVTRPVGVTQVDLHCRLRAERELTLNGDLQHAGIHFRAHEEVNARQSETSYLESPSGVVAGSEMHWCRLLFPRGPRWYAATLLNAPTNPVEELSQRNYGRFGYFFARALVPGELLSLNYRLRIVEALAPEDGMVEIHEAEAATLGGGGLGGPLIDTNQSGYTGSGYLDFNQSEPNGEFVEWSVPVTDAGSYATSLRYAFGASDRPLELRVNGMVLDPSLDFPTTGGWATWDTLALDLNLNAGINLIRLTAIGSSGPNLDHLAIQLGEGAVTDGGPPASRPANDVAYADYVQWLSTDEDHDGQSTNQETLTGTDPLDSNSLYRVTGVGTDPSHQAFLTFEALPGRVQGISWSENLHDWFAVPAPSFDDLGGGLLKWTDLTSPTEARRFYRVTTQE